MTSSKQHRILFVGSFISRAADGTVGGNMADSRTLLDSPLSETVEWLLIDSTSTQPPPSMPIRLMKAAQRLLKFLWLLIVKRPDRVLILSSYHLMSTLEKGMMARLGRLFGAWVVLSFRSEIRSFSHDRYALGLKRFLVHGANRVICQSDAASQGMQTILKYPTDQIIVIPNWIDTEKYRPTQIARPTRDHVKCLFVGWIENNKGVFDLLDAMQQITDMYPRVHLTMCGKGTQFDTLQQQRDSFGLGERVSLVGWVYGDDLIAYYHASDIFILPSYSEGMPNAILEAMAAGLPIISTPVGGIPQLVTHRQNGLLISPGDRSALAEAIRTLATDPAMRQQMGQRSQERAEKEHNINHIWRVVAHALDVLPD